eukprot:1124380-Rhodomonas_salina.3
MIYNTAPLSPYPTPLSLPSATPSPSSTQLSAIPRASVSLTRNRYVTACVCGWAVGSDGIGHVWELESGSMAGALEGHKAEVSQVEWNATYQAWVTAAVRALTEAAR